MTRYQPALLGGVFIGVMSSLPIINIANCCCLWVIAGGVLTTYLLQQREPLPLETGTAMIGGVIAGAIGAVVPVLMMLLVPDADSAQQQEAMEMVERMFGEGVDPAMRDRIISMTTSRAAQFALGMVVMIVFAIFAMLGALLGLAFFRKKLPPQPPVVQA